jgi:hypothetical protein
MTGAKWQNLSVKFFDSALSAVSLPQYLSLERLRCHFPQAQLSFYGFHRIGKEHQLEIVGWHKGPGGIKKMKLEVLDSLNSGTIVTLLEGQKSETGL